MNPKPRWWGTFPGTPLALEQAQHESGDPCEMCGIAGLQYYAYARSDGLGGKVIPHRGDRLSLMRRPDNAEDGNAIEVWWRNEYHLGHLPRGTAAVLAPEMDAGKSLRAYVMDAGDGRSWSMTILLIGQAMGAIHAEVAA